MSVCGAVRLCLSMLVLSWARGLPCLTHGGEPRTVMCLGRVVPGSACVRSTAHGATCERKLIPSSRSMDARASSSICRSIVFVCVRGAISITGSRLSAPSKAKRIEIDLRV